MKAWGMLCADDEYSVEAPEYVTGYGETPQIAVCSALSAIGITAAPVATNGTEVVAMVGGREIVYVCDWSDNEEVR